VTGNFFHKRWKEVSKEETSHTERVFCSPQHFQKEKTMNKINIGDVTYYLLSN